jgi:WD40 repeat protein
MLQGYQILQEIGRGGAGVVFRAQQLSLNRPVAVKLLLNSRMLADGDVQRFRKEAQTIAQLRHRNIVSVHEVGEENGQPWFSMELIEGKSLADVARQNPLPPLRAARLVRQVARAVEHAHQRGIFHRDLKPSNVVVDPDDEPHVTDFGLALQISADAQETLKSGGAGTPSYMAPEQVNSKSSPISAATDVWGIGAILYQALTGRPPFIGNSKMAVMEQILTSEPICPRLLNPSVPKDLETICLKCLRKPVALRYQSAREVAEELDSFEAGLPIRARPISLPAKAIRLARRQPLAATLICVLVLALIGWALASDKARRTALSSAELSKAAAREKQRLLTHQLLGRGFEALSQRDEVRALPWLVAAWKSETEGVSHASDEAYQMRVGAALASMPTLAALWKFSGEAKSASLSPAGDLACAGGEDGTVFVWSTKTCHLVSSWTEAAPIIRLAFLSDTTVLVACGLDLYSNQPGLESTMTLRNFATGERLRSWKLEGKVRSFEISSDGRYVAVATSPGMVEVWDLTTAQRASPVMKHSLEARKAIFTPESRRLISCSFDETVRVWDWRRGQQENLLRHTGYVRDVRLSPDGATLATASDDGSARLWNWTTGAPVGQPLKHDSRVYNVVFSPDGQTVATASSDSTVRLWNARTGEPKSAPLVHLHRVTRLAFSPDGRYLLTSTSEGLLTVWDSVTVEKRWSITQTELPTEISWLRDSNGFISTDSSGLARQWMLPTATRWRQEFQLPDSPNFLVQSPARNQTLVGLDGGLALLWDWDKRPEPLKLEHRGDVLGGDFFRNGRYCWTYTRNGPVRFWDTESANQPWTIEAPGPIRCADVSPNGEDVAIGEENGECRLQKLASKSPPQVLHFPGRVEHIRYSQDGRRLAGAWYEPNPQEPRRGQFTIRVWEVPSMTSLGIAVTFPGRATIVTFSPDGKLLATSTTVGTSHVVAVERGRVLASFDQPGEVKSVDFGQDGKTLLTAGGQGVVRLWATESGQLLTSAFSQNGVARAAFSRDKAWILAWGKDLRAQLWDSTAFEPLLGPQFHQDAVIGAGISSDRRSIVTAGLDLRVRLWPIPRTPLSYRQADRLARVVSGHAVDPTGTVVALSPDEIARLWREQPVTAAADQDRDQHQD